MGTLISPACRRPSQRCSGQAVSAVCLPAVGMMLHTPGRVLSQEPSEFAGMAAPNAGGTCSGFRSSRGEAECSRLLGHHFRQHDGENLRLGDVSAC
jgi:hypothetical protein